jgi:hypothetical protein
LRIALLEFSNSICARPSWPGVRASPMIWYFHRMPEP